jgi:N-acetylglucosamine kinase-like BadF-type ATPase
VVRCADGEVTELELGTVNRCATGAAADQVLADLFARVRDVLGERGGKGWLASASAAPEGAGAEIDRVLAAATRVGLPADLVLSNDVVPLLVSIGGRGVVVVCGTGSGFLGGDGRGGIARVGGCEYLGSDEGGAVDIGLRGLRAAVRSADGRGPATRLVEGFGDPVDLARRLAMRPSPKQGLADLAPVVTTAWMSGDEVAAHVVTAALDELVVGVRAVRDRLGLTAGFPVATAGGVLTGCPAVQEELARRLGAELGAGRVELFSDTANVVLTALTELLDDAGRPSLPTGLAGRHMWLLSS